MCVSTPCCKCECRPPLGIRQRQRPRGGGVGGNVQVGSCGNVSQRRVGAVEGERFGVVSKSVCLSQPTRLPQRFQKFAKSLIARMGNKWGKQWRQCRARIGNKYNIGRSARFIPVSAIIMYILPWLFPNPCISRIPLRHSGRKMKYDCNNAELI